MIKTVKKYILSVNTLLNTYCNAYKIKNKIFANDIHNDMIRETNKNSINYEKMKPNKQKKK